MLVNIADDDKPENNVYVTTEFLLQASVAAGCDTASCSVEATASVRVAVAAEVSGTLVTLGGVPVVGTVYYEMEIVVEGEGWASVSSDGASVGTSASASGAVTVGVEVTVGELVTTGASLSSGGTADAEASLTVTLTEISYGVGASVGYGTALEAELAVEGEVASVETTLSVCSGCLGGALSPSIGFSGCTLTTGATVGASIAVGAEFSGETSIDFCEMADALEDVALKVVDWGEDVATDVAAGLTDSANAIAAVSVDTADMVADHVEDIANDVADAVSDTANEIKNFAEDAVDEIASFGEDAVSSIVRFFG